MLRIFHRSGLLCLFLGTGAASAQPINNSCVSPQRISGPGAFSFNTAGAGTDGPDIGCANGQVNNDVWFCWTAGSSGDTRASLCGGGSVFNTVIAVYSGCACPVAYTEIACNDDSCGNLSAADFTAVAGQTYMIRVGGLLPGQAGSGSIRLETFIPGVVLGPIVSPVNGNTYYLLDPSSWSQGQSAALQFGGNLATVRSDAENDWIYNTLLRDGGVSRRGWIGLNDAATEGAFVWASGEPVRFTRWGVGQPNDGPAGGGGEDYAQIPSTSSQWDDTSEFPVDGPVFPIVEIGDGGGGECAADFNADGFIDFFDYGDYVTCFETGTCPAGSSADFNNDNFVDFFDYSDYVAAFEAGC